MKTVIRHQAFETNSSSTHSICVMGEDDTSGFEKFNGQSFEGLGSGEYGWEQDTFYGFWNKLDYLFLYLNYTTGEGRPDFIKNGQAMLDWLKGEFESRGKTITLRKVDPKRDAKYSWETGEGYIDHQSVPMTSMEEDVLSSQKALLNFLFNDSCYFETDNDNH